MPEVEFSEAQKQEIEAGIRDGLDVFSYAKPEFLSIQMRQIRLGLMAHLPVERYASADYDWFQMEQIRKGLAEGLDVSKYANPAITYDKMRQIRKGLEAGIDLTPLIQFPAGVLRQLRVANRERIDIRKYIMDGYTEEQLEQIRIALGKGIEIDRYITPVLRGASIREIALGLSQGLDVSVYADAGMSWQQMKELRLGMEARLDVTPYRNPLYSWQQMREIRLGMEDGLNIKDYSSLMYTAKEMKKRRTRLLAAQNNRTYGKQVQTSFADFTLVISADWMQASVLCAGNGGSIKKADILAALAEKGIVYGIDEAAVEAAADGTAEGMIVVARGTEAGAGADGWYEYFFDTEMKKQPAILEDGTADYQNIKWFEIVKKNQKVAYYHAAETGAQGTRINGEKLAGQKGRELAPLKGRGIVLLPDKKTYLAAVDGKVELRDGRLEVTNMLILENVTTSTGNVDFNGAVYVRGAVGEGVTIKAAGDLVIDGYVEAAAIDASGDIILRKGSNAGGKGSIRADGDVFGNFFENVKVTAGASVNANYCLNCEVKAGKEIAITGKFGSLAGGSASAGGKINSYDIGNQAGIVTYVNVGVDEGYNSKKAKLDRQIESVCRELELLDSARREFLTKYTAEVRNSSSMYLKVEDAIYTKEKELEKCRQHSEAFRKEEQLSRTARITARGRIYPGVTVEINGAKWKAKETPRVTLRKTDGKVTLYSNHE